MKPHQSTVTCKAAATNDSRQQRALVAPQTGQQCCSTPLLFINKGQTSDSLSRSNDDDVPTIYSHVQRWRNKPTRQQKSETFRSKTIAARKLVPLGWQVKRYKDTTVPPSTYEPTLEEEDEDLTDRLTSKLGLTAGDPTTQCLRHREGYKIMQANFSEGDCVDPFSVTAIPIDSQVQSILQYYTALLIPVTSKAKSLPKDHRKSQSSFVHQHSPTARELVRSALSNKMHMYAVLTATAGRMRHISGFGLSKSNAVEYFMQKAIACLRIYLKSCTERVVDKQVIMDIFNLGICEWYLQNYHAALTHLRAVGHMMESLDPTSQVDQYIKECVCHKDVSLSIETATPPLFPLICDVSPLTALKWEQIRREFSASGEYRRTGGGFAEILSQHIFSPAMGAIITEFMTWVDVRQYVMICKTATEAEAEWMYRKGYAILHRLLSISAISPEDVTVSPLRRKEECFRIVLVILLSYVTTQTGSRSGKMNVARLRKALWSVDHDWGSDSLNRMLLWVLICGAFAAGDTADQEWFLSRALRVAQLLGIGKYNELGEVMGQYFYLSKLQYGSMCTLANRILEQEGKPSSPYEDQMKGVDSISGDALATTLLPCQEGCYFEGGIGVCILKFVFSLRDLSL